MIYHLIWVLKDIKFVVYGSNNTDLDSIIKYCINNYSPMCVNINWDLLYKRYTEQYD